MKNTENGRFKNIKPNKNRGAADIYILAIMFILLILIIVFSSFRTIMLSEVIYTIDDAVVDSALGAITPDINNTQQIIVTDNNSTTEDYTPTEKQIIASERTLDASDTNKSEYSTSTEFKKADTITDKKIVYNKNLRPLKAVDSQMHKLLNRVGSLISNNLSNSTTITQPEIIDAFDKVEVGNALKIKNSDLKTNSFVGDYLASDIDITRLEAYSVYKYTLAKRHIYASPWFKYAVKVNGVWQDGYTWDGNNILDDTTIKNDDSMKITLSTKDSTGSNVKTTAIRDMVNTTDDKCRGIEIKVSGFISTTGSNAKAVEFDTKYKAQKDIDKAAYDNRATAPLIFFEDTGITCQTSWYDYTVEGKHYTNELNKEYGFLWNNDPHSAILIDKNSLTEVNDNTPYKDKTKVYTKPDDYTIGAGKIPVIPIEGYASYIYILGKGIQKQYNPISSTSTSTADTLDTCISTGLSNKDARITFGDYNNDGTLDDEASATEYKKPFGYEDDTKRPKIFNTSLYVEGKYTVKTFITGDMFNIGPYSTKDVRVSKFVSLSKGEKPE